MVTPSKMQAAIGVPPSGASPEGLRDMNVGRMRILPSRQERIMQGEVAVPCARGKNTAGLSTILLLPLEGIASGLTSSASSAKLTASPFGALRDHASPSSARPPARLDVSRGRRRTGEA
jgi:hypothetical protein